MGMKVTYTHIVGIETDEGSVRIRFRPCGSDTEDNPVSIYISPHDTYVHLDLNFAEFKDGGQCKNLSIKPTIQ